MPGGFAAASILLSFSGMSPQRMAHESLGTLLIVEDNTIVGAVLERVLMRLARVVRVATLREAIVALAREPIDLILTDYRLKDGDGSAVLRHSRTVCPLARRILTSGGDVPGLAAMTATGLVDGFLEKPFSGEKFRQLAASLRR